jgi:Family of unknown function (DUF5367)
MRVRLFLFGLAIWMSATAFLRLAGQHLLRPGNTARALLIFAITFPLIAWLVRRICRRFRLPRDRWLEGAFWLLLPTLLLDPFSSAFFSVVFPNMAPEVAGASGGVDAVVLCERSGRRNHSP